MPFSFRLPLFAFAFGLFSGPSALLAQSCIADDFNVFLPLFNADIAVQKTATADPLIFVVLDFDQGDEPVPVSTAVPLASLQWPVLQDLTRLDTSRLKSSVSREGEEVALLISGLESGEHMTWYFRQMPCWTLVRIADLSM